MLPRAGGRPSRRCPSAHRAPVALALLACLAAALAAPAPAPALVQTPAAAAETLKTRCPALTASTVAGEPIRISLRCRGLAKAWIRVLERPRHGKLGVINQRRDWVLYRPDAGYTGRDRFVIGRKVGKRWLRTVVRIRIAPQAEDGAGDTTPPAPPAPGPEPPADGAEPPPSAPAPPSAPPGSPGAPQQPPPLGGSRGPTCSDGDATTPYQHVVTVQITCTGNGLVRLWIAAGPTSGALSNVQETGTATTRTLTATYTPDQLFVGKDTVHVVVSGLSGAAHELVTVTVLPWRMRVIGDSVSAGFGYFGNGSLMSVSDLLECMPGAVVSNRCSSNSDAGPGYDGPPTWSADFGLANDVAWAAQFANRWQGGGHITAPVMFQNRAVTGSAPSDWLSGGILHPQLEAIVAENPDLVAMTLGANPLLSELLLTVAGESCSFTFTVAALQSCVQPFFDAVDLRGRLEQVYTELLQAPNTKVVVFQYHLAIPAATLFATWQIEAMIDLLNENIAEAVASTKSHLPADQADRLYLIRAQTDPNAPNPLELPRFNTGLPPSIHDSWIGHYNCGGFFDSDGPSHQSGATQTFYAHVNYDFCPGEPWVIDADSGIHPSRAGYAQFAKALTNFALANDLVPTLP